MNTYLIPREIGDENKFLFFSTKSLIFTIVFGIIGIGIYFLMAALSAMFGVTEIKIAGIVIAFLMAGIGYCLGAFKIPELKVAEFFKNAGGDYLDEIIKRVFKFYKRRKIYIYERSKF